MFWARTIREGVLCVKENFPGEFPCYNQFLCLAFAQLTYREPAAIRPEINKFTGEVVV
jgi:hypothetical protein